MRYEGESEYKIISHDKEKNITILECQHSTLIVNGSPSKEAVQNFVRQLSQMKAEQRVRANELVQEIGKQFIVYSGKGLIYIHHDESSKWYIEKGNGKWFECYRPNNLRGLKRWINGTDLHRKMLVSFCRCMKIDG